MIALSRFRASNLIIVAWFGLAALAAALAIGARGLPLSGGTLGLTLAVIVLVAPIAVYIAICRPMIVPFALWAALVPLEDVFAVKGGSIERLLGVCVAGAAVVQILLRGRSLSPPRAAIAWVAFTAFGIASLTWTANAPHAVTLLGTIAGLIAVMALASALPCDRTDLAWMFSAIVVGGVATAIYAIWIMMHTHLTGEIQRVFFGRSDLKIDPNFFGASMIFPAMISFVAATTLRNPFLRLACGLAAVVIVLGILTTESRGSLLALGVAFTYAFSRSRVKMRFLPVAVAAVAMIALYPQVLERFTDPHFAHGSGRTDIWRVGFAAFKDHWLLGNGFGSFRDAYQAAYLDVYQPEAFHTPMQDAHNLIVYVGVESGIIGLALIGWAYWEQFRVLRVIRPSSGGWFDARVALEAAMLALLVNSLSLDLIVHKSIWLCIGAAWVFRSAYRTAYPAAFERPPANSLSD